MNVLSDAFNGLKKFFGFGSNNNVDSSKKNNIDSSYNVLSNNDSQANDLFEKKNNGLFVQPDELQEITENAQNQNNDKFILNSNNTTNYSNYIESVDEENSGIISLVAENPYDYSQRMNSLINPSRSFQDQEQKEVQNNINNKDENDFKSISILTKVTITNEAQDSENLKFGESFSNQESFSNISNRNDHLNIIESGVSSTNPNESIVVNIIF